MSEIDATTNPDGTEAGKTTQWLAGPPPPPPHGSTDERHAPRAGGVAGLSYASLRSAGENLRHESPWMLASAGLLVALGMSWAASFVSAFEHGNAITAQERILRVFAPGAFLWVLGAIVAVALCSAGRRFEVPARPRTPLRSFIAFGTVLAGAAAAASAAIGVLVELTNLGNGFAAALSGLIGYVGSLVLAGALAWWSHSEHQQIVNAK